MTWINFKKHFGDAIRNHQNLQGTATLASSDFVANSAFVTDTKENFEHLANNTINNTETIQQLREELTALKEKQSQSQRSPLAPTQTANQATAPPPASDTNTKLLETLITIVKQQKQQPKKRAHQKYPKHTRNIPGELRKVRRYPDNDNYCHRCGYDIVDAHTSATCKYVTPEQRKTHQPTATADNPMGGSMKNMHLRNK
jgi:hypothetical protein